MIRMEGEILSLPGASSYFDVSKTVYALGDITQLKWLRDSSHPTSFMPYQLDKIKCDTDTVDPAHVAGGGQFGCRVED